MDADILVPHDDARRQDSAKRRQIMEGARAVFFASGFDGASMNDVARSAGVSKGTLYAYFESKEDLFKEIIKEQKALTAERLCGFTRGGDVREMLADFGRRLLLKLTDPAHISLGRVVIGATEKFPAVGRALWEAGPQYGATRLAEELRVLEKARGCSSSPIPSAPPGSSSTSARAPSTSASCSASSTAPSRRRSTLPSPPPSMCFSRRMGLERGGSFGRVTAVRARRPELAKVLR